MLKCHRFSHQVNCHIRQISLMSNTPQTNLKTEGVSKPCEQLQHLETSTECSLHILKSVNVMQENWTFLSKMINAQRARVRGKIRDYEQTTVK